MLNALHYSFRDAESCLEYAQIVIIDRSVGSGNSASGLTGLTSINIT